MNLKIFGPTWNDNYLELLKLKTMKLLGSTENKITKYKNGENTSRLETTKVFLVHCNTDNNDYQYDSLCKVQTNLEKSGKPGKIDFFEKSQGISGGKLWENMDFSKKIRENSGKFFMEYFSFKTL